MRESAVGYLAGFRPGMAIIKVDDRIVYTKAAIAKAIEGSVNFSCTVLVPPSAVSALVGGDASPAAVATSWRRQKIQEKLHFHDF